MVIDVKRQNEVNTSNERKNFNHKFQSIKNILNQNEELNNELAKIKHQYKKLKSSYSKNDYSDSNINSNSNINNTTSNVNLKSYSLNQIEDENEHQINYHKNKSKYYNEEYNSNNVNNTNNVKNSLNNSNSNISRPDLDIINMMDIKKTQEKINDLEDYLISMNNENEELKYKLSKVIDFISHNPIQSSHTPSNSRSSHNSNTPSNINAHTPSNSHTPINSNTSKKDNIRNDQKGIESQLSLKIVNESTNKTDKNNSIKQTKQTKQTKQNNANESTGRNKKKEEFFNELLDDSYGVEKITMNKSKVKEQVFLDSNPSDYNTNNSNHHLNYPNRNNFPNHNLNLNIDGSDMDRRDSVSNNKDKLKLLNRNNNSIINNSPKSNKYDQYDGQFEKDISQSNSNNDPRLNEPKLSNRSKNFNNY